VGAVKTRILLADDHPLVRTGLRQVIDRHADLEVVAEASDGAEAVEIALREDVDLAILDVAMPRLTGLQAAEQLRRSRPQIRVLMLSMYDSDQYLLAAARAGARGYVLKSVADEVVVEACRSIIRSDRFVYPRALSPHTRTQLERARETGAPVAVLTRRELEVLKLVAEGHSSAEIASLLVISPKTVESHRANIMDKLGARDRVELTRYAIRHGLAEP
jgi:DNA-binding NarL/FixJ family response regulator